MLEFIGRLHPLLVHLPIGILLLAVLLYLLSHKERFASFQTSVVITVFIGGVSALLSCITGYILSLHNADEGVLVTRHQNLALLTTGISIAWFYALATDKAKWMQHTAALLTVTALSFTGHLGGTLTHGEGYLFANEEDIQTPSATPQPVKDVKEAMLYADLVQPLLQEKCVSCHGAKKQKGRLRLDAAEFIQKGGEDGMVVIAGQADGSELIRRINLPIAAKAHMPPRDKNQLTTEEIALLHFWVQSGLTFDQRVRDLIPKDPTADYVRAISDSTARISSPEPIIELPEKEVPPADPQALEALRRKGAVVLPVDRSSSYLQLNFVAADSLIDQDMPLLLSIKEQLVWLDLGGKPVGDAALRSIGQCTQLRKLNLRDTKVTDKGMRSISGLSELTYLNLSGTQVTAAGMKALSRLRRLRSLYLHRSGVTSSNWASIQSLFPTTVLDTGGYSLPVLEGDTTFLK